VRFRSLLTTTRGLALGVAVTAILAFSTARASAEAALLVDAGSGAVLYAENAGQPWYPASVTKIMTAYVILKAVKDGRISLDTPLTVSANAVAQQPSKMGFAAGTQVTVDNALKMLMVKSANDMAVVLAEGLSGSIEDFATEMNRTAQRLGMTQTSYVNPNGLPADGQVTSARDLAILARAAIKDMPEYDIYWHISAIKFGKRVMRNYNTLIDRYPGADGMKTGFICASGFNLVATATRGGRRLIAVVLGSRSGMQRAEKAAQLLERGFTGGGLTWLMPALGTVESIKPVHVDPPNMREEICNPKGKRRPRADNEEEPVAHAPTDSGSPLASVAGFRLGPATQGSLIGPLVPSMAPMPVHAGLPKKQQQQQPDIALASGPGGKKKGKGAAQTAAAAPPAPAAVPATQTASATPTQATRSLAARAQPAAAPAQEAAKPTAEGALGASILPSNGFIPQSALAYTAAAAAAVAEPAALPAVVPMPRAKPKRPKAKPIAPVAPRQ
jgi:D-alanyl-D-alanine carboxypeptidase